MPVLCEKESHKLGMDLCVAAELPAEEAAYEVSVNRGLIPREMDILKLRAPCFKIRPEHFYLSGFSGSVKPFKNYEHPTGYV